MNSSPLRHTVTAGQAEFKDPIYFSRSVPTSPRNRLGRHRNSPYGSISQGSVPNFEPIQEDIPSSPPHFGPNNVLEVPKLNYSCHVSVVTVHVWMGFGLPRFLFLYSPNPNSSNKDLSTQSPPSLMAAQLSISKKRQRVDSYQDSCLTSSSSHRGSGDTSDQTMNSKETDDTAGAGAGARYPDDPAAEVRYNYTSRWSTDSEDGRICGRGCNAQSKIRKRIVSWARKRLSSTGVLRDSSNNTKS